MTRRYELDDEIGFLKTRFAGTHVDLYAAPLDRNANWDADRAQKQKIWRRFFAVLLFEDWDSITEKVANTSDHLYAEWLVRACYAKRNLREPFDGHFEEPSAEQATYMSFEEFSEKDGYNQRTRDFSQILAEKMAELQRVKNEQLKSDVKGEGKKGGGDKKEKKKEEIYKREGKHEEKRARKKNQEGEQEEKLQQDKEEMGEQMEDDNKRTEDHSKTGDDNKAEGEGWTDNKGKTEGKDKKG
ncbi:hypothetical protein ACO1O0_007838 [Amphichorda felina]